MQASCLARHRRAQRGVYAIEFAFVFLISFGLIYAMICYGFLLTMRLSLQNAAEDGARAGLRYQTSLNARKSEASSVAVLRSDWLPGALKAKLAVDAKICLAAQDDCAQAAPACGPEWSNRCQVVVTVAVTGIGALFPAFPSFALPDRVTGKASMRLDGRSL